MLVLPLTSHFHFYYKRYDDFADLGNCVDYTKKPENNQSPDRSNFLLLECMYGNVKYISHCSSIVNGTEGLYCTSSNTDDSEVFKQRKLHENVGLAAKEFSQYAKLLSSEPIEKYGKQRDGRNAVEEKSV